MVVILVLSSFAAAIDKEEAIKKNALKDNIISRLESVKAKVWDMPDTPARDSRLVKINAMLEEVNKRPYYPVKQEIKFDEPTSELPESVDGEREEWSFGAMELRVDPKYKDGATITLSEGEPIHIFADLLFNFDFDYDPESAEKIWKDYQFGYEIDVEQERGDFERYGADVLGTTRETFKADLSQLRQSDVVDVIEPEDLDVTLGVGSPGPTYIVRVYISSHIDKKAAKKYKIAGKKVELNDLMKSFVYRFNYVSKSDKIQEAIDDANAYVDHGKINEAIKIDNKLTAMGTADSALKNRIVEQGLLRVEALNNEGKTAEAKELLNQLRQEYGATHKNHLDDVDTLVNRQGAKIYGKVTTKGGTPLEDFEVASSLGGGDRTDSDGKYEIYPSDVGTGSKGTVSTGKVSYGVDSKNIAISAGEAINLDFVLDFRTNKGVVTGKVTDAVSGTAIGGVDVGSQGVADAKTIADGTFKLIEFPVNDDGIEHVMEFGKKDYLTYKKVIILKDEATVDVAMTPISKGGYIKLVARDEDDVLTEVDDIESVKKEPTSLRDPVLGSQQVDSTYVMAADPGRYFLKISKKDYEDFIAEPVEVKEKETTTLEVKFAKTGIKGMVVDDAGEPVGSVTVISNPALPGDVETDAKGEFKVVGLDEDRTYTLKLYKGDYNVDALPVTTEKGVVKDVGQIQIKGLIPKENQVRMFVYDFHTDKPMKDVEIQLNCESGEYEGKTDERGLFSKTIPRDSAVLDVSCKAIIDHPGYVRTVEGVSSLLERKDIALHKYESKELQGLAEIISRMNKKEDVIDYSGEVSVIKSLTAKKELTKTDEAALEANIASLEGKKKAINVIKKDKLKIQSAMRSDNIRDMQKVTEEMDKKYPKQDDR